MYSLKSLTEYKKPKYWNTMFASKVLDAYDSGKLKDDKSIEEWEVTDSR